MSTDWAMQVRVERAKRGWTQKQLATAVGTSQSHVARVESGETNPTTATIERFMAALDGAPVLDRSARARYMPAGVGVLHELDVTEMLGMEAPPVEWIVEGLAARGGLTILAGMEGAGKSLLTQALAVGVAGGTEVAGIKCQTGRVWLLDAENGPALIHRRLRALGVTPDAATRLKVWDAAEGFDLSRDRWQIIDAIDNAAGHGPDLIVLDSFKSLWDGSESNPSAVVAVLNEWRALGREYGIGILLIHHTTKGGDSYRGSSAIGGAVEAVFKFQRAKGKGSGADYVPADPNERVMVCHKMRLDAEPETYRLRIGDGGRLSRVTDDEGDE